MDLMEENKHISPKVGDIGYFEVIGNFEAIGKSLVWDGAVWTEPKKSFPGFFEAGKTYMENAPYRAPEITGVVRIEWVGMRPCTEETEGSVMSFGFTTNANEGSNAIDWDPWMCVKPESEDWFEKNWVEAERKTFDDGTSVWVPKGK
jgi:hypothetical protein